jgi:hypothetical protein
MAHSHVTPSCEKIKSIRFRNGFCYENSRSHSLKIKQLVPLELDSGIFWQNIFEHLDVALYSCGSEGNSRSVQLSCLVPATPG